MRATATRDSGYRHVVRVRSHDLSIDEPTETGGSDAGPSPQELLAASLAGCTAVTMEMYATRKGWDIGGVEVACEYTPAERGCPTRFGIVVRLPTRSPKSRSSDCASSPPSAPCTARSTATSCSTSVSSASLSRLSSRRRCARSSSTPGRPPRSTSTDASMPPCSCRSTSPGASCTRSSPAGARTCGAIPARSRSPGGRQDDDETDLRLTALREAEEEIGLPARAVELVGALQPTPTIATNYAVYPFVGLIEPGREWRPSANEVAEVMEVPLRALRAGYERRRLLRRGVPFRTDVYVVGEDVIWGATARIVGDLLDRLPDDLA